MGDWDSKAFTPEELKSLLIELKLRQSAVNYLFVLWCTPWLLGAHMKVFEEQGFKGTHVFYWVKPNMPIKESIPQTPNVETAIFAWSTSSSLSPNSLSHYMCWPAGEKRYASITLPMVQSHFTYEKKTNKAEKPWQLCHTICRRYCPPGGNVLILGPGFGGDLEGALRAGCNVVAVEKNEFQFKASCARVGKIEQKDVEAQEVEAAAATQSQRAPSGRAVKIAQRQASIQEMFAKAKKETPFERLKKLVKNPGEHLYCSGCGKTVDGKVLYCYVNRGFMLKM